MSTAYGRCRFSRRTPCLAGVVKAPRLDPLGHGGCLCGVSGHSMRKVSLDHDVRSAPGAGQRRLAAMDSCLRAPPSRDSRRVPTGAARPSAFPGHAGRGGTARQGADVPVTYKETARGGPAVQIVEC
ncbi:hypothetical protein Srut_42820 [Streptomyces rutgersensis]|nr:hypothetical protein Srut_42820 [Streptomyces rutgersensis]